MHLNRRGYTLYLVLLVLSIAAILFSITIADIRSMRVAATKEVQLRQAKLLAESGIVRTEFFLNGGDGHSITWETPGYEETIGGFGAIHLIVEQFGLFSRVVSTGKRFNTIYTAQGLFGRNVPQPLDPTLTLTGHVGGLILHKGSSVEGDIVLHHGYIYAKKKGNPLSDYTRRLTLLESPPLPFDTLQLPEIFEKYSLRAAELLQSGPALAGPLVLHGGNDSLLRRTALIVNGDCRILTSRCSNSVIVVSGVCTVEGGAVVRSTLCCADRIKCEGGTTDAALFLSENSMTIYGGYHNSQFLSRDSIAVGASASFGKMTVIAGYREEHRKDTLTIVTGGVRFEDNMNLRGTVICFVAPQVNRNALSPSIVFGKGCTVLGTVVTDGDCYIYECDIAGRLWARSIVAKDADGSYTNYLIASTIKPLVDEQSFPLLGDVPMRIVFTHTQ